jgi:energy-coupling factor transporter ATP-binding protein EcfA2
MNVSTFTRKQKFGYIAGLLGLTALLLFTRTFPFILLAAIPASIATLLIMRRKLLRKLTKSRIMQVAYAELIEPITQERTRIVGRDDNGRPIEERETVVVGHKRRDIPLVEHIDLCYVDLQKYISRKANPLVMICGRSGMGKSELMKMLLLTLVGPKIIFSFKPNDAYLSLPYEIIDVSSHIPDPFQHAEDFATAYALTFPANVIGIMLSQVRAIIKSLARDSKDWNQFSEKLQRMKKKATNIQAEALALIEQQIESLVVAQGSAFTIDLTKDTVLDFSRLEESAKTFYAEVALRQIWRSMTGITAGFVQPTEAPHEKATIMIDEVHRLTQLYEMDARSILDTIMLQVRQFGKLYAATQNYSDINDRFRNQFGTQLTFNTTSERDLEAIRKIDPSYVWIVKELYQYEFIDLTFHVGNIGLVPIFQADLSEIPQSEKAQNAASANIIASNPKSQSSETIQSVYSDKALLRNFILELLENEGVAWASLLAQRLIEKYHGDFTKDKDTAKLSMMPVLNQMVNTGQLGRTLYLDMQGTRKVLCYISSPNLSPLHNFMVNELCEYLSDAGFQTSTTPQGAEGADIIATSQNQRAALYIEIETGLKNSGIQEATEKVKIHFSKTSDPLYIVVPNDDVKRRYSVLHSSNVNIVTVPEFVTAIKQSN